MFSYQFHLTELNLINAPREKQKPTSAINMLFFLLFSIPSAKHILTWDIGSPSKGRDPEQDIPFSHEGDLTAYIQGVMEETLISLAKPYVIYLLATHFVRVK